MRADLDDPSGIERIDASDMLGAISRFPDYFLDAVKHSQYAQFMSKEQRPQNLVMMGMGGSASAADVAMDWLIDEITIPGMVLREPDLPVFVDSNTLFVAISYSGQTSETLTAFREASGRGSLLVGIGSGGRLESMCRRFDAPFVPVAPAIAPRAALGQLTAAAASTLERFHLVQHTSREMVASGKELVLLRNRLRKEIPLEKNPSKRLAVKLQEQFLAVYSPSRMSSVARRFKNQLAENSKVHAKCDVLPESGHNEVEAWHRQRLTVTPLIIRDSKESSFETSVIQAFISTIRGANQARPIEVRLGGRSWLSRLLLPIFFLDYVSVYLAILKKIDPTPTPLIDEFKRLHA
jgi:glucose/mannose-6-phosphate isomerase